MGGPAFGNPWPPFGTAAAPSLTDIAQGNLAAHYLWSSPAGGATLLNDVKGKTEDSVYFRTWEEMQNIVCCGGTVAGLGVAPPTTAPPGAPQLQAGLGTVAVVNGSSTVNFSVPQTFAAGTLFVFYSQPGVYYALVNGIAGQTTALLSGPYSGTSAAASTWAF